MHVLYILAFYITLFFGLDTVVGLDILKTIYTTHRVQIDNYNNFGVGVFKFTFDQEIRFVSNVDSSLVLDQSSLYSRKNTSYTLCFPPLECFAPSNFSLALYDTISLTCPSEEIGSSPSHKSDVDESSPRSYLILLQGGQTDASTEEPFLKFFSQVLNLGEYAVPVKNDELHAIIVLSYTLETPLEIGGRVRKVESELSQCTFNFGGDASEYSIIGHSSNEKMSGKGSEIQQQVPQCSWRGSVRVRNAINETVINMTNAPDWTELQRLRFQNALLESSNAFVACSSLVENYIDSRIATTTVPQTTLCSLDINNPSFATDPCCNNTLQFLYCCAPDDRQFQVAELTAVNNNVGKCDSTEKTSTLLNDYIVNANLASDMNEGCRAVSDRQANTTTARRYVSFVQECLTLIYGTDPKNFTNPPLCKSDSDCFTYCSYGGTCVIDPLNMNEIMTNCHMKLMDPFVKTLLKAEWKLPADISDANFQQEYFERMSSENCYGYWSGQQTWEQVGVDFTWVHKPKEDCLARKYCTYTKGQSRPSEAECTETGGVCIDAEPGTPSAVTIPQYCVDIYAETQQACEAKKGTWDLTDPRYPPCTFPALDTIEKCTPSSVCPVVDWNGIQTKCPFAMCFHYNRSTCPSDPLLGGWLPSWANGTGLCVLRPNTNESCMAIPGAIFYPGRVFIPGIYHTEETCKAGMCVAGNIISPSYAGPCARKEPQCSRTCRSCVSKVVGRACYKSGVDKTDCPFYYDENLKTCFRLYQGQQYNETECLAFEGYKFLTCEDLTRDQCFQCSNGSCANRLYDVLQCGYNFNDFCGEKACIERGGMCTDKEWFLNSYRPNCRANGDYLDRDCLGVCLHELSPNGIGQWGCPEGEIYTPIGCRDPTILTYAECQSKKAQGYFWHDAAVNQEECEAIKICQAPDATISNQSDEECRKCNGTIRNAFSYFKGVWLMPRLVTTTKWVAKNYTQMSTWEPTIDYNIVTSTVNRVVAQHFSAAIKTEAMCLFYPMFRVIAGVACDCIHDVNAPTDCFPSGTLVINIGTHRFWASQSERVRFASMRIASYETTVPVSIGSLNVTIDLCYSSQFRRSQTLSTNALSSSLDDNPFAVLKNDFGITIGQFAGDGVVLSFIDDHGSNVKRATPTLQPTSYTLKNPFYVCLPLRRDIPKSTSDFPVPDIALASSDWDKFVPQEFDVNVTDEGYCFHAHTDGRYFPILRVKDWKSQDEHGAKIEDKTLLAFIYICGIILLLLSFVCVYQMWVAWNNIRMNRKINLAIVLFFFLFLFTVVRGLYLLILPSGRLDSSDGGKYFLSEAPQFLYFSVYSVIIFAWAELALSINPRSFLEKFKWPFVITNILLYLLFIIVVSINQSISAENQVTLRKVYAFILAGCAIIAVIAFNVFGIKLMVVQLHAKKISIQKSSSSILKKLFVLLPVSSITLLAQAAFLIVIIYKTVSTQVALSVYAVTEIIPAATLIFTLRPLSRKLGKNKPASTPAPPDHPEKPPVPLKPLPPSDPTSSTNHSNANSNQEEIQESGSSFHSGAGSG